MRNASAGCAFLFAFWVSVCFPVTAAEVTCYGAAECVSGSMHLLTFSHDGQTVRMLVDCGQFFPYGDGSAEARAARADAANKAFPDVPWEKLDAVFLTHAHADHCGRLPEILEKGVTADVFCTVATRELLPVMMDMSVKFNENDISRHWRWSGRSRASEKTKIPAVHFHPDCEFSARISEGNLRTKTGTHTEMTAEMKHTLCQKCLRKEVQRVMSRVRAVTFHTSRTLTAKCGAEVRFTFLPAGHIPGSASVLLEFTEDAACPADAKNVRPESKNAVEKTPVRVIFSGDRGGRMTHVLQAEKCPAANAVIMEGTYGVTVRDGNPAAEITAFRRKLGEVIHRGGVCLVPVFALDRAQRVLEEVRLAKTENVLPADTPVYLYSPTAQAFSRIYAKNAAHPEWFSQEKRGTPGAFGTDGVIMQRFISVKSGTPAVVVATTGMMSASYSLDIFRLIQQDEKSALFLVGYQMPGSRGAEVREQYDAPETDSAAGSDFRQKNFRCEVTDWKCFSGHADAREMDAWLDDLPPETRLILVHGDKETLEERRNQMRDHGRFRRILVAQPGVPISITP